jgi:hypothetical protein
VENLPSIVEHGLLSRKDLIELEIDAWASDGTRLDETDGAISVSISSYYFKMISGKIARSGNAKWICLLLDPNILWALECHFYAISAASRWAHTSYNGSTSAFLRMFEDRDPFQINAGDPWRERMRIPDNFTSLPEMEVQVLEPIPPEAIIGAWVDNEGLAHSAQAELNRLQGEERDVHVFPFQPRHIAMNMLTWG